MKKGFKIYLFRHGQTTYNRDKIFTGFKDAKLTSKGVGQAKVIAKKMKSKKFDVAIQTRLSRSKDTLKYVLKGHKECKLVIVDDRVIERSYGNLSGKSHESVIKQYGQVQFDKWHRGYKHRPPKGESFADVEKRVRVFIKSLKKMIKKDEVNVAISAHGNSIRLFRKVWEGLSVKETEKLNVPYDKVFVYSV
jgi:2,3-bisphosphoglycerate-dependent phosphoglycerate mutase